jgi:hypothetical protein
MRKPVNADDIDDDALLLRRIDAGMLDRSTNQLQSWAWRDQRGEVSVYLAAETTEEKVLSYGLPGQMIIRIKAGAVRKLGHIVVRDPEPDEPAHCIIHPHPEKRIRKKLCERSSWD